jgi:hypothetical protein
MYRLPDDDGRLAELSAVENPSALADEIALARFITERAAQREQFGLSLAGLNTLTKLANAHQSALIRASQHLDKQSVIGFGRLIVEILWHSVDTLPLSQDQKADFVDGFLQRFMAALEATHNGERKQSEPLLLEKSK